jgi:Na+/proline symporter
MPNATTESAERRTLTGRSRGAIAEPRAAIADVVHDTITRTVAIVALCGIALIHLLDLPGKFSETPYMGVMYLGAIAGSLGLATVLTRTSDRRAWAAAAALAGSIVVGFVLSRTTGLPNATGDIGNWSEPLGMASLFVEAALVCLSAAVLSGRSRVTPRPAPGF